MPRALRVSAVAVCALLLALAVVATVGPSGTGVRIGLWTAVGLGGGWAHAVFFAPSATVGADTVVVRNPLRRHVIAYADVESVSLGLRGLLIRVRDRRRPVTVWAVQKSTAALRLDRRRAADDFVDAVRAHSTR
jgi:hypothetical protein